MSKVGDWVGVAFLRRSEQLRVHFSTADVIVRTQYRWGYLRPTHLCRLGKTRSASDVADLADLPPFGRSGPRRRAQPQGGQVSGPRSPIPRDLDSYCTVGACAQPCTGEAMQRRCNVRCRHVDRRHSTPGPGRRRIDSIKSEANPESRDQRHNRRFLLICHRIDRRASFVDDTRALLMLMPAAAAAATAAAAAAATATTTATTRSWRIERFGESLGRGQSKQSW